MEIETVLSRMSAGAFLVVVGTMAGSAASAAPVDDHAFLTTAIEGNLAEIALGQLAQEKGSTPAVKDLGKVLVQDHSKANEAALAAAKTLGVTPPNAADAGQTAARDRLAGQSGAAFDRAFANAVLDDQRKAVAAYQAEADASKDAAGQYALQTLPALKDHFGRAGQLADQTRVKISDAAQGLASGRNSFTQSQARARLQHAGFNEVSALRMDNHGIWRGTATRNGVYLSVAMDFRGKIASQ